MLRQEDVGFVMGARIARMCTGRMTADEFVGMFTEKMVALTIAGCTGSAAPIEDQLARNVAHYRELEKTS